jgi:hypothetical protein
MWDAAPDRQAGRGLPAARPKSAALPESDSNPMIANAGDSPPGPRANNSKKISVGRGLSVSGWDWAWVGLGVAAGAADWGVAVGWVGQVAADQGAQAGQERVALAGR